MNEKRSFYKGLSGYTRADDEVLARDISGTIYEWWWKFMRISPVFWYARNTGEKIQDVEIQKIYEMLGDLEEDTFSAWWLKTGKFIFQEEIRPVKVKVINSTLIYNKESSNNSLYLEVPLSITKETIIKQIKKLLKDKHEGRNLDVTKTSTAQLKLYTKKYRLKSIENEYWVLLYRLLYPKIEIWRIGDRLKIRPDMKLRDTERRGNDNMFRQMSSVVGRFLYKANFSLFHVHYGNFPNINKSQKVFLPFGKSNHKDFISKTTEKNCDYIKWLNNKFGGHLRNRIITKNRLDRFRNNPANIIWKRLPTFIAGETDYLDAHNSSTFADIYINS
jgi:hypothetical protein